ncbi:MAG: helix-turn-helix transcriptional regulator [Acetobacteraceae bacterium]|nr:helix-turn-helix transcriptional regulator [Acetobacteraceae bacterium]
MVPTLFRLDAAPFGALCKKGVRSQIVFSKENFVEPTNVHESEGEGKEEDWHPADVLAALKKRGLTLAGLSIANGYHPTAAGKALKQSWPAVELLIAAALEVRPQTLWPSRYAPDGLPHGKAR